MSFLASAFIPNISCIFDLGAQHCVPAFLHLNTSVISALRKQVKESKETMHDPGQSGLGSAGCGLLVVVVVVVVVVRRGGTLLLSQQMEPPNLQVVL